MVEEIMKMLDDMPNEELSKISNHIFKLYEDREPAVTLRQGQIVEWKNWSRFPPVVEYGFSEKDQFDCKKPQIIQYLREYKSLRMTYVDASQITIHDECVDIASVFSKLEEIIGRGSVPHE
ncbi:MAG: hypothetical protein IKH75_01430 [Ruminococcus sp.]|nr:hypothetical protein [Ruminococcus sp.]